jgi:hypothetical protein
MACGLVTTYLRSAMKTIYLLCLGVLLLTFQSCNYFKPKHPQADLPEDGSTGMTEKTILNFAGSIDRTLKNFKKEISLVYTTGDISMYVEKYSEYNNGMLYNIYSANGNISNTVKSYYFKNDSLILVKEQSNIRNEEGDVYKDIRTYLRNNVTFRIDSRTAASEEAIQTLPYLLVQPAENKYPQESFAADIKGINDAILGADKFEMVFDNITTYPESHYINLKNRRLNTYKAAILVNTKDAYIDSLLSMPALFKDEKLKLKWNIVDNEAVYVPVADTTTSASGLNR